MLRGGLKGARPWGGGRSDFVFKHLHTAKRGNCLRVGVRARNASVSGLRVGPSKIRRS